MEKYEDQLITQAGKLNALPVLNRQGSAAFSSPSNIAIVKYWGKYPGQIPANASLSMTLSKSLTNTEIAYEYAEDTTGPQLNFLFEGKEETHFTNRIANYLNTLLPYLPWLKHTKLRIATSNTFPHSSGIASSASAMSALALGLCALEEKIYGIRENADINRKASFLARLGSGSASRSIYGQMAVWGLTAEWKESSDEYAIPLSAIHENFIGMKDSILIIESGKKEVSSSLGHQLMKTNPFAASRFDLAERNMQDMSRILKTGDIRQFIDLMENEALTLHAMMITSTPGFILMKPNTLKAIQSIRSYRNASGRALGFTLDAGANVHVLYPKEEEKAVKSYIESELKALCENEQIIHDEMGTGPMRAVNLA